MDFKKILVVSVIVLAVFSCLSVASAGWFDFLSGDVTLESQYSSVTLPKNFTVNDNGTAVAGDIKIQIVNSKDTPETLQPFREALATKGNASGYMDYKNGTIGNFSYYEFTADPKELKNISTDKVTTGAETTWMEFPPQVVTVLLDDVNSVQKFREVDYINSKDNTITTLLISTNNSNVDLHSADIDNIVNSIAEIKK